jgi:hypothetical protein
MWSDFPQMPGLALELRESIGWDPVLWLGWEHQKDTVKQAFPETPWQMLGDAWFGRPIVGVSTTQPSALDEDLWSRLQKYMPRLMNQMNRFGPPEVFLYDEREAFARDLLVRWHELLTRAEVEVAFWEESPSVPFSYAAYVLCRELGIQTVSLIPTRAWGLSLLRERIEEAPLGLDAAYQSCLKVSDVGVLATVVEDAVHSVTGHDDFRHRTELTLGDWEKDQREQFAGPAPTFTESGVSDKASVLDRSLEGMRTRGLKGFVAPIVSEYALAGRMHRWLKRNQSVYVPFKLAGERIDADYGTHGDLRRYAINSRTIKKQLREDYSRRCIEPDLSAIRYVYFPLHYRPERTSNPDGGIFYDQIIPLAMVSEALPDGWKIYVKEHGVQFYETLYGECGRTREYYDDIARLRGVQFISADVPSKELVRHAQAVASITGTVCWEAALLGKPAAYFGFPWYMGCPGTTRVGSAADVRAVLSNPQSMIANQDELRAWHIALGEAGFPYEFNAWQAEPGSFTDKEQTEGLRAALEWWHHNRYSRSDEPTR